MSAIEATQLLFPAGTAADLVLGRYRLGAVAGRGGMSTVYEAQDVETGRAVAVKLLALHLGDDEASRLRLLAEANALARLSHPNIVTLLDFGECPNRGVALVMELVEGETLHARMQRGPLPLAEAVRIAEAVGSALAYAHRAGVVHRDVKPSNILLAHPPATSQAGGTQVKLADFGIARSVDAATTYTAAGHIVGSVPYIAPEILRGRPADARSDVYALGVTLFQMLAGRLPFPGDVPAAVLSQRLTQDAPAVERFRADVPEALARLVARALAQRPEARFQTMSDLLDHLRRGIAPAQRRAGAATRLLKMPQGRRRIRTLLVAASLGVLSVASIARGVAAPARNAVSAESQSTIQPVQVRFAPAQPAPQHDVPPAAAASPPTHAPSPTVPPTVSASSGGRAPGPRIAAAPPPRAASVSGNRSAARQVAGHESRESEESEESRDKGKRKD